MTDNKKLKNKEAAEFILINAGNNTIDLIPKGRKDQTEEAMMRQDYILEQIISTNQVEDVLTDENKKPLNKELEALFVKIRSISKDDLSKIKNENFNMIDFLSLLNINKDDLNDVETNFLFDLFNLSGATVKEYNEFGLPKNVDPDILNYCTKDEFNPETDEYVPPIFENLHCNREDIDFNRNDLEEDYREVYDQLMNEDDCEDELPDDFVMIANEGYLPIKPKSNIDEIISNIVNNKHTQIKEDVIKEEDEEEEEVVTTKLTKPSVADANSKKQETSSYKPSYKYITPEEKEWLDKQYKIVKNEYVDKTEESKTQIQKNKLSKEKRLELEDALREIEEIGLHNKFPNKMNDQNDDNEEDYDEEEEFEEYEDIEEDDDEFDKFEKDQLRIQDGVDLLSKEQINKLIEIQAKNEEKAKDIKKTKKKKKNITWEEIDALTHNREIINKTIQLFCEKIEREGEEGEEVIIPNLPDARNYKNIINKIDDDESVIINQPRKIGVKNEYIKKVRDINQTMHMKDNIDESTILNKTTTNREVNLKDAIIINKPKTTKEEIEKLEKKERKKLVKQENKERREKKKEIKELYEKEKCKIKKNISSTNQIMRSGLSVKEI